MQPVTSVTQALDLVGMGRAQWLLLLYCGAAWSADACETMLLSYLGPSVACAWPHSVGPAAESALTSVVFAGMLMGVYILGAVSDAFGRRRGFLLSALLLGAAGLASAAAPSFGWLLVLRTIVGVALGGTPIAVTLFAEFCPSHTRGTWMLALQAFWTVGTMVEALLAWSVLPVLGWRWLLALSALPMLGLLGAYPWLPESPHWLVAQKRYGDAEAVLCLLAATNKYPKPLLLELDPRGRRGSAPASPIHAPLLASRADGWPAAEERQSSLQGSSTPPAVIDPPGGPQLQSPGGQLTSSPRQSLESEAPCGPGSPAAPAAGATRLVATAGKLERGPVAALQRTVASMQAGFRSVLSRELRATTLLLWCVWFVNAITYYGLVLLTTELQRDKGREQCTPQGGPNFSGADYRAVLVTSFAEAPGLLVAAATVDRRGRKWSIRAGLLVCAAAVLSLLGSPGAGVQVVLLFVARGAIEGTFSVLYIYAPELYPTAVRSFGLALCNAFSRFGGFAAPFATVYLVEKGRTHAAEGLLGILTLAAGVAAFALRYETRGRDLQEEHLHLEGQEGEDPGRRGPGAAAGEDASFAAGEEGRLLAGPPQGSRELQ